MMAHFSDAIMQQWFKQSFDILVILYPDQLQLELRHCYNNGIECLDWYNVVSVRPIAKISFCHPCHSILSLKGDCRHMEQSSSQPALTYDKMTTFPFQWFDNSLIPCAGYFIIGNHTEKLFEIPSTLKEESMFSYFFSIYQIRCHNAWSHK